MYTALEQLIGEELQPDVLVGVNSGFWEKLPGRFDVARLVRAAKRAVARRGGQVQVSYD
jgi:hypothetical protein